MTTTTEERHPRDPLEILTEALEHHVDEELGAELRSVRTHFENLRHVAALVSTAAAKHTGAAARARKSPGYPLSEKKIQINADAVGRLHNAAKNARRILDGGACAMCTDAADAGLDVTDRAGTCAECGRVLGLL